MVFSGKNKVFLSVETLRQNTNVFLTTLGNRPTFALFDGGHPIRGGLQATSLMFLVFTEAAFIW